MKYFLIFLCSCGPWLNPSDAYRIEIAQCQKKPDPVGCETLVRHKYGRYWNEGGYPALPAAPQK